MKEIALTVFAILLLASCSTVQMHVAAVQTNVCAKVYVVEQNKNLSRVLDAVDPHSAAGVLWVDLKASCPNGQPAPDINQQWLTGLAAEAIVIIPEVVPAAAGII